MRRKLAFFSLLVPIAILIVLLAASAWLFETEAGLQWTYSQIRARVPGMLEIGSLEGKLGGPLHVVDLSYKDDGVEVRLDRAQLRWSPTALLIGRLQIDALSVDGLDAIISDSGEKPATAARRLSLPLNVDLADVRLERLRIQHRGRESTIVDTVELAGFLGRQIVRVDRLKIDAPNFAVDADGALGVTGDTKRVLRVHWRFEPPGKAAVAGSGEIRGNLSGAVTATQQIVEPIAATLRAEIHRPLAELQWRVDVDVPEFDASRLGLVRRSLQASGTIAASGGLARFEASGMLRAQTPDFPPLSGSFRLHGTTSGDDVALDQLVLRAPDTDAQLTAQARWLPRETTWTIAARWQNLHWPLTGGDTILTSPQGTLDADGTYERFRARFDFATAADNFPRAQWRATASGDRKSISFTEIAVDALGSTSHGAASVAWSPQLRWNAQLSGRMLDPAIAWPDWSGSLSFRASLSGSADEMRADVGSLSGTLRGQPFAASASVTRRGDDYPHIALKIGSGDATATVSGALGQAWKLSWRLSAPNLAAVLPGAAGSANGNGRIDGARARPRFETQMSVAGLVYKDARIREASLDAAVDFSDNARSHAALLIGDGTFFKRAFERIAVTADGLRNKHSISIDTRWSQTTLKAELRGGYGDTTWSGSIQDSTVLLGNESWTLSEHPKLIVGPDRLELEQACWRAKDAKACVALRRGDGMPTTLSVLAGQLPLAFLAPLLPNSPEAHGTVSGNARLQFDASRLAQAEARLDFSAGEITLVDLPRAAFAYDSATCRLVVDKQGLRADAAIALPGGDGGGAELALPQFHTNVDIKRQPIEGRLTFNMRNLAPLAALLPRLEELSGSLRMTFAVAGTLADPRVTGEAAISDAAARIPATGIRVHDVSLAADAPGSDELRVTGEAQAGSGRLALSGRILFPENRAWRAELHLTGDQFQVADLRETQVFVSPDLQAKLTLGEIDVTGDVRLPKASFALRSQKPDVLTASPDVVIVNAPESATAPESAWKVTARIRVILGDAVSFSGFGLNAKIAGEVALAEAPTQATTARGEVRVVKGQYQAYGQKLDIERGRLVFVGGPVNNPGIDARAVRKIDTVTAGVEVRGTLQAPRLTLFSDPAMSQSDTLSYLVFGRPLEGASAAEGRSLAAAARALQLAGGEHLAQRIGSRFGIEEVGIDSGTAQESAALVLGKQLSPRLYINYSIGLFTPANVLHLKYKLSKRWSLEAQSGAQAGGDLIFSIEK